MVDAVVDPIELVESFESNAKKQITWIFIMRTMLAFRYLPVDSMGSHFGLHSLDIHRFVHFVGSAVAADMWCIDCFVAVVVVVIGAVIVAVASAVANPVADDSSHSNCPDDCFALRQRIDVGLLQIFAKILQLKLINDLI